MTTANLAKLDATDQRIIQELVADGRLSVRELAERVFISRGQAYVRLERLERSGVIAGFTARIAHAKVGLTVCAFVALSLRRDCWFDIADQLKTMVFVDHFSLLSGEVDVLVLVRATDNQALRVVLEELQNLRGVHAIKTWLIFDECAGLAPYGREGLHPAQQPHSSAPEHPGERPHNARIIGIHSHASEA